MNNDATKKQKRISPTEYGIAAIFPTGAIALLFCLLVPAPQVSAVGFRLPNQDPEAIARGNAFTATADNPSAIYYNPAGITQITQPTVSAGLYLVSAGDKFEGQTGQTAATKSNFQPVPQFYFVYPFKDLPLSFGYGVYVPYGLSLDWGNNNPFNTVAQNGSLLYTTVNPVIAWQIIPSLSLGVGPTLNYSKADFNQSLGLPGSQFHFVGDAVDFGFNAGLLWQPYKMLSFGLNYRYADKMDYKGHSSVNPPDLSANTSGTLQFPQFAVAGVSFRPTENWNIEFDLDWTDWGSVNSIDFKGGPGPIPPFQLNYTSSFMYEFGVTRKLPKGYFVSAGYFFSENSSPSQYFDPQIPDSDLHLFSLGFGHKGVRWDWAASYTFAINPGRTLTAADNNIYQQANPNSGVLGTYRTINQAINVSVAYKF